MRILLALLLAVPCFCASAADPTPAEVVKKLAAQMLKATLDEDYAVIIDLTFPKVVAELGGREKAIEASYAMMRVIKDAKFVITELKTGEPGAMHRHGANQFIVVPTLTVIKAPDKVLRIDSYLLGISGDDGKTWKFVDGAGMKSAEFRQRMLPELPPGLVLPEMTTRVTEK